MTILNEGAGFYFRLIALISSIEPSIKAGIIKVVGSSEEARHKAGSYQRSRNSNGTSAMTWMIANEK